MKLSELGDLYSTLLEAAVDAIITIDEQGFITSFNSAAERLFGYSRDEVVGRKVNLLMPPDTAARHDRYLQNYLSTRKPRVIGIGREVEGQHRNGSRIPLHFSVGEAVHEGKRTFIGICHDLSKYREIVEQLEETEQRYRDIVESQKQLICRVDSQLRITFANASFSQVIGVQHDALMGLPLTEIADDDEHRLGHLLAGMFRAHGNLNEVNIKVTMKSRDSGALVDWSFKRVDGAGDPQEPELQGFGIDISQQEAALQQALYLRNHDYLTGFLNMRAFSSAMKAWIEPRRRYALLHLACGRFEMINRQYGYDAGDNVIVEAAKRIRLTLIRPNLCARTGSDMLVVIGVRDNEEAHDTALQLVQSLERPYRVNGSSLRLDVVCGIALYPADSASQETLQNMASSAARDARDHGATAAYFDADYHEDLKKQMEIEQGLKEALDNQDIEVYLQPKIGLDDHTVHSYEALVRWQHPERGFISPADFIPIAERSALGQKLDRYVLNIAAQLIARCRHQSRPVPVIAVNVTARHFSDLALPEYLEQLMRRYKFPPESLQLEITEGMVMQMRQTTTQVMERLRTLGIQVSIDDFGTGYSSLSYLSHLLVDELKIDKVFIDDLQSERGATLVRSVIAIAKANNLRITAEGIETAAQARILRGMDCDMGQGYFFARPKPGHEVLGLSS
ncbi:putative bifunctional diguanylate cyclase/phosphodiesterase [Marinobacter sp. JSM 1782161]|uniref:putative bifunctional diguanylate cyclase/phosphodiesterase n=1 Tax=Marinobacter sp. JSM 1782161 TaxID=2685906 RepID=UPI0014039F55|nr:EAL domain-containing protein [Marinobacter sp. JSM 1782161]